MLLINPNPAAKDDACTVVFGLALVLEVLGNSSVDIAGFDDILLGLVLAICIGDGMPDSLPSLFTILD